MGNLHQEQWSKYNLRVMTESVLELKGYIGVDTEAKERQLKQILADRLLLKLDTCTPAGWSSCPNTCVCMQGGKKK